MSPQDKFVEVNGLRFHYLDWGHPDAPPMVLLHGLEDCAHSWDFFAEKMQPQYHVLALDQRGHGDSAWAPRAAYKPEDYAEDVKVFLERLALNSVIIVGHGSGGRSAVDYAAAHPGRVHRLILVEVDPEPSAPGSSATLSSEANEHGEWDSLEAVAGYLRRREPNASQEILLHHARYMTKEGAGGKLAWKRDPAVLTTYQWPGLWKELSTIQCPTLIVRGRQSTVLDHEVAVKMRETVPRCRLTEPEDCGHWVYDEFPGAFEAAVSWFLDSPPT